MGVFWGTLLGWGLLAFVVWAVFPRRREFVLQVVVARSGKHHAETFRCGGRTRADAAEAFSRALAGIEPKLVPAVTAEAIAKEDAPF